MTSPSTASSANVPNTAIIPRMSGSAADDQTAEDQQQEYQDQRHRNCLGDRQVSANLVADVSTHDGAPAQCHSDGAVWPGIAIAKPGNRGVVVVLNMSDRKRVAAIL